MLNGLARSTESVEAMQLDRYWHPEMNWYGPAGIGTARQVRGFRLWHQIPFLNGMPNRRGIIEAGRSSLRGLCRVYRFSGHGHEYQWAWLAGHCTLQPGHHHAKPRLLAV
ncbi:MAG UNVERIFIED_CONTAM: hypothetical protein LVT10_05840 [Anaerolineae bacterium]